LNKRRQLIHSKILDVAKKAVGPPANFFSALDHHFNERSGGIVFHVKKRIFDDFLDVRIAVTESFDKGIHRMRVVKSSKRLGCGLPDNRGLLIFQIRKKLFNIIRNFFLRCRHIFYVNLLSFVSMNLF